MITCPNKNTQQWKELASVNGEDIALHLWDKFQGNVPLQYYGDNPIFNQNQDIIEKIRRTTGLTISRTGFIDTQGRELSDGAELNVREIIKRNNALFRTDYYLMRNNSGNYSLMSRSQGFVVYNTTPSETISNIAAIKILDTFKKRLGINYEIVTPAQASGILENSNQPYGDEPGFFYKNKVYVVDAGQGIDFDTTIHEFGHAFIRAISKSNRPLFESIMKQVLATPEGQQILKEVTALNYSENQILEEVGVRALTVLAKENIDKETGTPFKTAMQKLMTYLTTLLKNLFNRQDLRIAAIPVETSLQQLADIFSLKEGSINVGEILKTPKTETNVKPGIQELFDSNPELANAVYEALGFNDNNFELKENKEAFGKEPHPEGATSYDIFSNGRKIGKIALFEGKNPMIKGLNLNESERNKGLGKALYKWLNYKATLKGGRLYADQEFISPEAQRVWESLNKEGLVDLTGNSPKFNDKQKQQAQQLYSQYLDTIFPESKVKDIVYHGSPKMSKSNAAKLLSKQKFTEDEYNSFLNSKFDTFDFSKSGSQSNSGIKGAAFFTTNPKVASFSDNYIYQAILNITDNIQRVDYQNELIDLGHLKKLVDNSIDFDRKGLIIENVIDSFENDKTKLGTTIAVFKSEQIHILGNKQNIEGFKNFVESETEEVSFNRKVKSEETLLKQKQTYDMLNPVGKISKSEAGYVVLGETGYTRVTEKVRKTFNLGNLSTSTAQQLGDIFHAIAANKIKQTFPEFNKHFKAIEIEIDEDTIKNVHSIVQPLIDKAMKDGSVLIAELPVANTQTKIAGTIDLLELTANGKAKMLDYKTSMSKGTVKGKYKKLVGNSEQQILYKEILAKDDEKLGRRGLEITYQSLLNILSFYNKKTKTIQFKVQETVPIIFQTSKNKKRDEMLEILYKQIEKLSNSYNKENADKVDALIKAKRDLMIKLQEDKSDSEIIKNASYDLYAIESYLNNSDYINNYIEFRGDLELYKELRSYIKTENKSDIDLLDKIQGKAARLYTDLYEKSSEKVAENIAENLMFEGSPIQSPEDILKPALDTNLYQRLFKGASYSSNPIVAGVYLKYTTAINKIRNKTLELSTEIKKAIKELEQYTGSTGEKIYQPLIQYYKGKPTGYVVDKYSPEFYDKRKQARNAADVAWFRENAQFDEERYNKALERYEEMLKFSYKSNLIKLKEYLKDQGTYAEDKIDEIAEKLQKKNDDSNIKKWKEQNNSILIFNKPKDKWIDPKWRDIKEGKYKGTAVEKFYDLYTRTMDSIENDVLLPFDIRSNFIADFRKSFLDRVINSGIGNMKLGRSLVESLSIPVDEAEVNKVDAFTGEFIRKIPIAGRKVLDAKERAEFNEKEKSYDLGKSLAVFFESAYRYKELIELEKTAQIARDMLVNQKEQILNLKGEQAQGGFNMVKLSKGLENTVAQFNDFINHAIYGKTEDKESGFEVKGNSFTEAIGALAKGDKAMISWSKSLDLLLKYTGLNNLGYSLYSPVTNLLGGKTMQLLTGVGNKWYSTGDYSFATAVVTAGPFSKSSKDIEKGNLFLKMFSTYASEMMQEELDKLQSGTGLYQNIPKPFTAMKWSEEHLQNAGLLALIKSNKHQIKWNEWEVEKGKLVYKGQGKMTDEIKEAFRQKAIHINGRSIGNMNPDDRIALKKYFLGRAVIQHRGWIPAMLEAHLSDRKYDYMLQDYVEGRFNSLFTFIAKKSLKWSSLDEIEKANLKELLAETFAIGGAYLLYLAIKGAGDDDPEKKKQLAYFLRISDRYLAELTFFSPFEIESKYKILISPAPTIGTIESWMKLTTDLGKLTIANDEEAEKIKKKLGKKLVRVIPTVSQPLRFIDEVVVKTAED